MFLMFGEIMKHSVKGNFNYVTLDEVEALIAGQVSGRVRR